MDYKEEQKQEIEALEAIYCRELQIINTDPWHKFSIEFSKETIEPEAEGVSCTLIFQYTPKYPEEPPKIEIQDADFEEGNLLIEHLQEQAQENLGMVMIFTLVSAAQEWLNCQWDKRKLEQQEIEAQRKREEEEAEMKRFTGTPVTVENFLTWKINFQIEMDKSKKKEDVVSKKITGKELFLQDITLNESDLKFLEEGDVKVDETLFEDFEDLDIEDDN